MQLNRVYARLQTFADNARRDAASASRMRGSRSKAGKARYTRYRGLDANANNRTPPSGQNAPFIALVSKFWARTTGNLDVHMLKDPANFTILSLDIPDVDIDSEHWGYLGDVEEEEDDDGEHGHEASGDNPDGGLENWDNGLNTDTNGGTANGESG